VYIFEALIKIFLKMIKLDGQILSLNCKNIYSCSEVGVLSTISSNCSSNSNCLADNYGNPVCVCKSGYIGDGKNCIPINNSCTCGAGATCSNNTCTCPTGFTGNPNKRCCDRKHIYSNKNKPL
jgi:hypothetical protein